MPIRPADVTLSLIFQKSVSNPQTGCVVWQGRLNHKGYGLISYKGKYRSTHRIVYEALIGEIPAGMHVLHRCDNRRCVNTEHLFLGTNRDNIEDKIAKDRSGKKLTIAKVLEIKRMLAAGEPHSRIAARFGIVSSIVSRIKTGHRWGHVTSEGG